MTIDNNDNDNDNNNHYCYDQYDHVTEINVGSVSTLLGEKKGFFGCPTGGTFKGSLNGSK